MNMRLYARRRIRNGVFIALSCAAAAFGIGWLALILGTLIIEGASGMSTTLFTLMTPPPGSNGGVANAIFGSVVMSALAVVAGTPIGIFAGTWLAEYGRHKRFALFVRFVNDILLSAPSILVGLFVYELFVVHMGHFSAVAGAAALAVIVIPVVVRTTENMLLLVPNTLREAAAALGTPRSFIVRTVTWRAARAGIITGVLLAIARISGETAPLLFTAFGNQFWSTDLNAPIASLPVVIFQFANSAYDDWHRLAWAAALLITFAVLSLSILARIFESRRTSQ
jgi:phosphate transport system permease protein